MKGYENVDEQKLLGLFHSKGILSAMPLLKDDKVFASDSTRLSTSMQKSVRASMREQKCLILNFLL